MEAPKKSKKENGVLQKLEETHLLRALIDLIPDPILIKDREGKYVLVNQAKLSELGAKDFKDVAGKTAFDFFDRKVAESFKPDDDQVLETGKSIFNRREKVLEPDGSICWHLTTKVPWRDADNKIVGLISISRDITESVVAEQKLQDERNLLRTVVDNMPDCIYAKDAQGKKVVSNPGDLKNLGCKVETEALGKTDFDFFPKEIADQFLAADQRVLSQGESLINHEEKVVRPDGETRWLLTSKIPWHDANGKIIGLVGIGRDITDRKNLEAQVQQAQRMESIGRLATGVAHDLNNILAPILISIELLRKKLHDEEYLKMLSKAEANAQRGADIIKQMLWFSRGLSGQRVQVDPCELVGTIAQFVTETFPKSVKVEKQIEPGLWTIVGDAPQLNQVLMNLVANARDAMPEGGTLTIGAKNLMADGRCFVVVEVTDTGVGIPPELLDRVFEPFFTTKEVGHGLGLSTTLSIIKSHGGYIKVESEPGRGAVFRVHLPAQQT